MRRMGRLVREQAKSERANFRQAFRAVAARNTHGKLIGVEMQALAGESVAGEMLQHYGFTSAPLPGAEYIVIPVGGNSQHSVVIASDDARYRVTLKDGEVAIYSDEGDHVHLKRGRVIEVMTETLLVKAGTKVRFETPLIETTGKIRAEDDIKSDTQVVDQVRSMQEDRDIYNGHQHGNSPAPSQQQ